MVLPQEVQHVFGLGGFGEGGVAAQIAEDDDYVASMTFADALLALRDDHLGQLWCQQTFQPPDPPEFVDLGGDALLETAVQRRYLIGPLPQLAEQPGVLDRDHSLVGEGADQFDLPPRERLHPGGG